jgi:hypothetical protein
VEAAPAAAAEANEGGDTPYDMARSSLIDRVVLKLIRRAFKKGTLDGYESTGSLDTSEHKLPNSKSKRRESRKDGSMNFDLAAISPRKIRSKKFKDDGSAGSLRHSDHGLSSSQHKKKSRKSRNDEFSDEDSDAGRKRRSKKSHKDDTSSDDESDEEESAREKKNSKRAAKAATLKAAALAVVSAQKASRKAEKQLAASMSLLQLEQEKIQKAKSRKSLADVAHLVMEKEGKSRKSLKDLTQLVMEKQTKSRKSLADVADLLMEKEGKSIKSSKRRESDRNDEPEVESKSKSKNWGKLRSNMLANELPPKSPPGRSYSSHRKVTISEDREHLRSPPNRGKSSDEILSPSGRRRSRAASPGGSSLKARASISGLPMPPNLSRGSSAERLTPSSSSERRKRPTAQGSAMLDDMLDDVVHPASTRFK